MRFAFSVAPNFGAFSFYAPSSSLPAVTSLVADSPLNVSYETDRFTGGRTYHASGEKDDEFALARNLIDKADLDPANIDEHRLPPLAEASDRGRRF